MRVQWDRRATKSLTELDDETATRIETAVDAYAETGRGDVKKLKGQYLGQYRLRVGKWRVYFTRDHDLLILIGIDDRGQAYR
jgi:mRNA interferase RelE/StbE